MALILRNHLQRLPSHVLGLNWVGEHNRCIKIWIVIYYRGLKFLHRAVVLLVLESDGACTGLNGHSGRKIAVLVLVWCCRARVIENRSCECTDCLKAALSSAVTSVQVMVASARSVRRGSNEAVTLLYLIPWPSCPTYRVKTQDGKRYVSHHWPVSPVTQQLGLCFLYCFSGLSALLLLTYAVVCKFWSCHELGCMECHPHTGFHYSKLLTYVCNDYSSVSNISGINFDGSEYRQVSDF